MKPLIVFLFILFVNANLRAQSGIIEPGKTFLNRSSDTLFFMPKSKVIEFKTLQTNYDFSLEKIERLNELTLNYMQRMYLADSIITLKRIEADIWYSKLQKNDISLEDQRKLNIQLTDEKNQIRSSRIYYFAAGILATTLVFIAIK